MKFVVGQSRKQADFFPLSLEEQIALDNEVRFIDAFVEQLKLSSFGFRVDFPENGRPAYHPKDLLKLYLYGYMNSIRSSRKLERECHRNLEVMWLLNHLSPDHNTISNFRRDNPSAIKKVFRNTVEIARNYDLIGAKLIAGDSTKLRAQNSKKNNYNQKKIDRHLEYIDRKLAEHEAEMASADGDRKAEIQVRNEKHQQQKARYQAIEEELKASGEKQISTSDPDSRHLITRNNITEVAYSVQSTVDAQHNLPIDFKVTNKNDKSALGNMILRAKAILKTNQFTALYDKGYHTGKQLDTAQLLGIETHVAIPALPSSAHAPHPDYNIDQFDYHPNADCYSCPQGAILLTTGTWNKGKNYKFKQYKTTACHTCPVRKLCTTSKQNGRLIHRSEHQHAIEINRENIAADPTIYKQRQAIVEHPFGTIKRQWGFSYIMTKRYINRAAADVGLIFSAYNLRRLISIIGVKDLIEMMKIAFKKWIKHFAHSCDLSPSFFWALFLTLPKPSPYKAYFSLQILAWLLVFRQTDGLAMRSVP